MLRNYLTVAIRNLLREKTLAVINIVGLAIGITCSLLLALYVYHEWSFDRFHEKRDRLFRVLHEMIEPDGDVIRYALTDDDVGIRLKEALPAVIRSTRLRRSSALVSLEGSRPLRRRFLLVDSDFSDMFTFDLIAGRRSLEHPGEALITKRCADALLSEDVSAEDLIGRVVTLSDEEPMDYTIAGVIGAPPRTATLRYDLILDFEHRDLYPARRMNAWSSSVYVELSEDSDAVAAADQVRSRTAILFPDRVAELRKHDYIADRSDAYSYLLQPLLEVRFDRQSRGGYAIKADRALMHNLAVIGSIVLLLAWSPSPGDESVAGA